LGHRVLDVDGSTITMADTEANQAEYLAWVAPAVPNRL
jgi:hypothetical protein